jgi:ABC-type branched-subunit amino acid transport system ATPase component
MALLETRGLSKSFGGLKAVHDLDLQVREGSVHGLIGPNGSGKSTFFNLVTGVYKPDPGSSVAFDGHDITGAAPHAVAKLGIARTFQLLRLFSEMTVLQNLMVGHHTHTPYGFLDTLINSSRVRRLDAEMRDGMLELLEVIGLAEFADMPASELSGGQRRLLALGRAMAMRPKLLMLDEPAAGLSPVNVDHLLAIVMRLKERYGLTILIVEHILKVVMETCDTVTVLDYGEKIGEGTPEEVKDDHAVIEAYLGQELADEEVRALLHAS